MAKGRRVQVLGGVVNGKPSFASSLGTVTLFVVRQRILNDKRSSFAPRWLRAKDGNFETAAKS